MHMKRIKHILVFVALLVIVLLITGCGSNLNLGASMSGVNETEETTVTTDINDEPTESDESSEYDYEDTEQDEEIEQVEAQGTDDNTITVVLNTNKDRKRIHIPDTSCANQIHEENFMKWTGTKAELVDYANEHGYVACGRCHPDVKLGIELPYNK